jgi:hypothetical protein
MYYAVRTFIILELYVLRIASRHDRFFPDKDPAVLIGYEAGLWQTIGISFCFFS